MSLDSETLENLSLLAEKWNTSKSEVIRRIVRKTKERETEESGRAKAVEALEWYQKNGIGKKAANRMKEQVRLEREAQRF